MVRNYKRKTSGPAYTQEVLLEAIECVRLGKLNAYQAAKKYNIPRMTIVDRLKGRRGVVKNTKGRTTVLLPEVEKKLTEYLVCMNKHGFGLSRMEVQILVAKYIRSNKIQNPFKNDMPGYEWFSGFKKRNKLTIKKPQAVEYSRKLACDPFIIKDYFETLEKLVIELKIQDKPEQIWNLDESSFSNDPSKTKVVGAKGVACTRTVSTPGKENTTVLLACNAIGNKIPPLIIFRGQNIWTEWMCEKPVLETAYAASKKGWIEADIFENYILKTFIPHVGDERPILLIYDGHSTHVQLSLIEKARDLGVVILKLPAHATHLLQPLDVAVFKSLKVEWDKQLVEWQRLNIGVKLPKAMFSELITKIWDSTNPIIIRNGFKKSGIYPLNADIIPEEVYDPEALKRWKKSKLNKIPVQSLMYLCLQVLSNAEIRKQTIRQSMIPEDHNKNEKVTVDDKQRELFQEITNIQPCCTKNIDVGNKIKVLENRLLNESEKISFETLLLQTVKKGETTTKKKAKVSKGCEVITRKEYIHKMKEEIEKKQKEMNEKLQKKASASAKKVKCKPSISGKGGCKTKTLKQTKLERRKIRRFSSSESSNESLPIFDADTDEEETLEDYYSDLLTKNIDDDELLTYEFSENFSFELPVDKSLEINDWVIVKFEEMKSLKHYVGNVISLNNNGKYAIKYVRKVHMKTNKTCFSYPLVDDTSELTNEEHVVCILPKPEVARRGQLSFNFDFRNYNIK